MPDPITIRRTRPDHPQVVALLAELDRYLLSLYAPQDNHILDVQALLAPEVHFLAAWSGDEVVGCGAVRRVPGDASKPGQRYGEIKRMYVTPKLRGQRFAEQLLNELEATLRNVGIDTALLETGSAQTEAVRLYKRCGYRRHASFAGYPDNGLSLFYAKAL